VLPEAGFQMIIDDLLLIIGIDLSYGLVVDEILLYFMRVQQQPGFI
jgi:hypothetical protein